MPELATDFQSLPEEYQHLIRLAEETHRIAVAPLQLLVGGWSGAVVYLVLKTPPVFWPLLLHLCAGAYGAASRPRDGLALLDEAMAVEKFSSSSSESLTGEFLSLKGDFLLALSSDNAADAESLYQGAVNSARQAGAAMVELQAAMRLSRLWQDHGKSEQARELLSVAYSKITEGFTTADMKEANALLAALSS